MGYRTLNQVVMSIVTVVPHVVSFLNFFKLINLFIFGCVGSPFLREGFL